MTGTKIASLYAEIGSDTTKLEAGLKNTKTGLVGAKDAFQQVTGVSIGMAGAMGAVAGALKFSLDAAMEAEKADANLNATLKSTEGISGMTAESVKRLTASLADMSGQDDEAIQNAESMLLTFTKIGKEVFPQASEAMVNMAAKFGSLDAASVQLGKALNDPVAGVTALRKIGVTLSEQQEKQIKDFMAVNNIAGAQKVILGELQTEFGGLAEAMGGTTQGSFNKLQTSLGNLGETVGKILVPPLKSAVDALNLLLTRDEKVANVLEDHRQVVLATIPVYEDYLAELIRAKGVSEGQVLSLDQIKAAMRNSARATEEFRIQAGALIEEEYNLARAEQAAAAASTQAASNIDKDGYLVEAAAKRQHEAYSQLATVISTDLTSAAKNVAGDMANLSAAVHGSLGSMEEDFKRDMDELNLKQEQAKAKMEELLKIPPGRWTPAQAQDFKDLKESMQETKTKIQDVQAAHEEASKKIIFDIYMQKLAQDGFTGAEEEFLNKMAAGMGIVDTATLNAVLDADKVSKALQQAGVDVDKVVNKVLNIPDKTITVHVKYVEEGAGTARRWGGESGDLTDWPPK